MISNYGKIRSNLLKHADGFPTAEDLSKLALYLRSGYDLAHVILAVEDDGEPSLTSYRRVILDIER